MSVMSMAEGVGDYGGPTEPGAPMERPDNLAEIVEPSGLARIGPEYVQKYLRDKESRAPWEDQLGKIYDHFYCYLEDRSFPWPGAAAAVTPVIAEACIHLGARGLQAIWDPKGPVAAATSGTSKNRRGARVSKGLNYIYQYECDMEDALDLIQNQLPLAGASFLHQDWDHERNTLLPEACAPEDVVVSYRYRGKLENAARISKICRMDPDDIEDLADSEFFLPDARRLGPAPSSPPRGAGDELHRKAQQLQGVTDEWRQDGLRTLIQMHTKLDLGGPEREPVIITIDLATERVLRISSRRNKRRKERCHFTGFTFLRNPTSGVYGIGLGQLMLSLAECHGGLLRSVMNSIILSIAAPILYADRSALPDGTMYIEPGKLIPIKFNGERLSDDFFKPPFDPPPELALQALALLDSYCQRLSTVSDVSRGVAPRGSNTTAYEVGALISEGSTVFSAIGNRSSISFRKAIDVSCDLLEQYMPPDKYSDICGTDSDEFKQWHEDATAKEDATQILDKAEAGEPTDPEMAEQALAVSMQLRALPATPFDAAVDFKDVPGPSIQVAADGRPRQERIQLATQLHQMVVTSPVTSADPAAVYAATRNLFEAHGVDDTLIEETFPRPQLPPPPPDYSPREENARALEGQPNVVLPDQDHGPHLAEHNTFITVDPLGTLLAPEGKDAMLRHMREHAAMLERQGDTNGQATAPGGGYQAAAPIPPMQPAGWSAPPDGSGGPSVAPPPDHAISASGVGAPPITPPTGPAL